MKPLKKLVATTGKYTDRSGQEKNRYQRVGTLFQRDDGSLTIKLDCMPIGEFNGWLSAYDLDENRYRLFVEGPWKAEADEVIGPKPSGHLPWKSLLGDPDRAANLAAYFASLGGAETRGAAIARTYLKRSKDIGEGLLSDGVARSSGLR